MKTRGRGDAVGIMAGAAAGLFQHLERPEPKGPSCDKGGGYQTKLTTAQEPCLSAASGPYYVYLYYSDSGSQASRLCLLHYLLIARLA